MIIQASTTPNIASEGMNSFETGVSNKNLHRIHDVLSDYIYDDKILATVREVVCNALDEHQKHGIIRPVEVSIRYENQQYSIHIRDFAKGLSEDGIRNTMYCALESDKDHSNDAIGGFGVGALAPNSYTSVFYTHSHYQGTKTVYAITKDRGDDGKSVRKLYVFSQEPTDQTGIEVVIPIETRDRHDFDRIIKNFIRYCPQAIVYNNGVEDIVPEKARHVIEDHDFTIRLFAPSSDYDRYISYKMGAVTYKMESQLNIIKGYSTAHYDIVVDIPIGRMTVPISRESFDKTRHNNEYLAVVNNALQSVVDQDKEQFKDTDIHELLKTRREASCFKGKYFDFNKKEIFPKETRILDRLEQTMYGESPPAYEMEDGKYVVAVVPNKKSKDMWKNRLFVKSKEVTKNWLTIVEHNSMIDGHLDCQLTDSIRQNFIFRPVKDKYFGVRGMADKKDKSDKSDKKWVVQTCEGRSSSRWNKRSYDVNALELHNIAMSEMGLEEAGDLEEAASQMLDMNIDSFKLLEMFTVSDSLESHTYIWKSSSKTLREQMKALGWFIHGDAEYTVAREKLVEEQRKINELETTINNVVGFYPDAATSKAKLRSRLVKNHRRLYQIKAIIDSIKQEDSLRQKLLHTIGQCAYRWDAKPILRHEMRKILKLK